MDCGYFIIKDDSVIGGVLLKPNYMSDLFIVPPFNDYENIADKILNYLKAISRTNENILLQEVLEPYVPFYERKGYTIYEDGYWMIRPTEAMNAVLPDNYESRHIIEEYKTEIADVIMSAYNANPCFKFVDSKENYVKHVERFVNDSKDNEVIYNSSRIVIHKDTNEIVGTCLHMEFEGFPLIMSFAVKPNHQGMGIGSYLIRHSINYTSKAYSATRLFVFNNNAALDVYEHMGFIKNKTLNNMQLFNKKRGNFMKILVYGAGVIGSIFAGKLAQCQHNVTVLARGNRFAEIQQNGIILKNPKNKINEMTSVNLIEILQPSDYYDYIIVAVQGTQIDDVLPVLAKNCSPNIVLVVNTAKGYKEWVETIGVERLMLGFPSAGGERKNGKVFYFIGKGFQRLFQTTTFGEYSGNKTKRVSTLINIFNKAGIPSVFCKDMDAWQKTHVALVTAIANALYGFNCDNKKLGKSFADVKTMVLAIKEGRNVLRKCKIMPTPSKLWWLELPTNILSVIFSIFFRTKLAETTMAKHCIVAKNEMIHLQNEFDVLIKQSKLNCPAIDKLRENLF